MSGSAVSVSLVRKVQKEIEFNTPEGGTQVSHQQHHAQRAYCTVETCRFGLCNDKLVVVGLQYLGNQNLGKEGFLHTLPARSRIVVKNLPKSHHLYARLVFSLSSPPAANFVRVYGCMVRGVCVH